MASPRPKTKGFSLAELLLALLILGQIAAFTIPKVLVASQNQQRTAVFKETIATINEIVYQGVLTGDLTRSTIDTYLPGRVNAVKLCDSSSIGQGCWTHTAIIAGDRTEPGFIMHNGATVCGISDDGGSDGHEEIEIDWNGSTGPNIEGDDQMGLDLCYDTGADCADSRKKPGTVTPWGATSVTFYQSIFK